MEHLTDCENRGLRYQQKSWTFFGQLGAFPTFPQWFGWVSFVGIHFYMPPSLKITGLSLKVLVGRNRHKRKTICLPSIHFQGRTVGFTECNLFLKVISWKCKASLALPMTPPPHRLSWPYKGIDPGSWKMRPASIKSLYLRKAGVPWYRFPWTRVQMTTLPDDTWCYCTETRGAHLESFRHSPHASAKRAPVLSGVKRRESEVENTNLYKIYTCHRKNGPSKDSNWIVLGASPRFEQNVTYQSMLQTVVIASQQKSVNPTMSTKVKIKTTLSQTKPQVPIVKHQKLDNVTICYTCFRFADKTAFWSCFKNSVSERSSIFSGFKMSGGNCGRVGWSKNSVLFGIASI